MRRALLVSLLVAAPALAQLTPDDIAAIQQEQAKAVAAVEEKYKGKTAPGDVRARMKETAAAERAVLEARGVKQAEWARATATMNADERAAVDAKKKALEPKAEAAKKPGAAPSAQQDADAREAAEMDKKMGLGAGKK
ncbi:MAG: hypothetical protein MUC96_02550 [Myxococcaceae bacterium]|jgi:hypothetical protein|nr:hypothetical protein [Myxococcaceae bacterium]